MTCIPSRCRRTPSSQYTAPGSSQASPRPSHPQRETIGGTRLDEVRYLWVARRGAGDTFGCDGSAVLCPRRLRPAAVGPHTLTLESRCPGFVPITCPGREAELHAQDPVGVLHRCLLVAALTCGLPEPPFLGLWDETHLRKESPGQGRGLWHWPRPRRRRSHTHAELGYQTCCTRAAQCQKPSIMGATGEVRIQAEWPHRQDEPTLATLASCSKARMARDAMPTLSPRVLPETYTRGSGRCRPPRHPRGYTRTHHQLVLG